METRDTCEGKIGRELDECLKKIEEMSSKLNQADEEKKAELRAGLQELLEKREHVWNKYQEMKRVGDDEWKKHHAQIENSMIALQEAMDKSYSRFSM